MAPTISGLNGSRRTPDRPVKRLSKNSGTELPIAEITPSPVIATRWRPLLTLLPRLLFFGGLQ